MAVFWVVWRKFTDFSEVLRGYRLDDGGDRYL
jgi:hypothetical protein